MSRLSPWVYAVIINAETKFLVTPWQARSYLPCGIGSPTAASPSSAALSRSRILAATCAPSPFATLSLSAQSTTIQTSLELRLAGTLHERGRSAALALLPGRRRRAQL